MNNSTTFLVMLAVIAKLLASAPPVWSAPVTNIPSEDVVDGACHNLCDGVSIPTNREQVKKSVIEWLYKEKANMWNNLVHVVTKSQILYTNHSAFDLREPCGYENFAKHTGGLSKMSKSETAVTVMLALQDLVTLNQTASLDAADVRNMRQLACGLRTLESKDTLKKCPLSSPMTSCKRDFSNDKHMTLGFLKGAIILTNSLITPVKIM